MEPRIYPPWEPRPLQELEPGLRRAVEAVRDEALPSDALLQALERAGQLPGKTPVRRPWFRGKVVVVAVSVAASLLVVLGVLALLPGPADRNGPGKGDGNQAVRGDVGKGLSYEERERLMANESGNPLDIDVGRVDGRGDGRTQSRHPLLRSPADAEMAYDHVRRLLLEEKRLPAPEAVRTDELVNSFPYRYASPRGEHPVAFTLNLVECPWDGKHHLLRVGLKGKQGDVEAIARDVKLQVEFNPRRVAGYRLLGDEGPSRADDFQDDRQPGVSLGAGHVATVLYEIVPAGLAIPEADAAPRYQRPGRASASADEGEWLTVKLRYKGPGEDSRKLLVQGLTGSVTLLLDAPVDCRFAAAVAAFGLKLRKALPNETYGWDAVRELTRAAVGRAADGPRAEFLKVVEAAAALSATQATENTSY